MRRHRVALVTCAELPDLDPDDRRILPSLAAADVAVDAVVWDDPTVDWSHYDLAVLRSTWDYPRRHRDFVAWASSVPRLANPAPVVAWNTDKRYLAELAAAGIPTVPTVWIDPGDPVDLPTEGDWVIKPAVGAGSLDTARHGLADPDQRSLARQHIGRLQRAGRVTMLQPYLHAVDTAGETALLYLGGAYSHAVRKAPMLGGSEAAVDGLYLPEEIAAREPTPAELAVANRALGAAPPAALLYARVDLIPGPDGTPVLVELELTEPSLYLSYAPGAADRFAAAILARLGGG